MNSSKYFQEIFSAARWTSAPLSYIKLACSCAFYCDMIKHTVTSQSTVQDMLLKVFTETSWVSWWSPQSASKKVRPKIWFSWIHSLIHLVLFTRERSLLFLFCSVPAKRCTDEKRKRQFTRNPGDNFSQFLKKHTKTKKTPYEKTHQIKI